MGFSCLTKTNLASILLSTSVWKWFCFGQLQRTCDDYFPNSLHPISYIFRICLGFICVRPECSKNYLINPKSFRFHWRKASLHWASVFCGFDYWTGSRIFNIDNEFPALYVLLVEFQAWGYSCNKIRKTQTDHLNIVC